MLRSHVINLPYTIIICELTDLQAVACRYKRLGPHHAGHDNGKQTIQPTATGPSRKDVACLDTRMSSALFLPTPLLPQCFPLRCISFRRCNIRRSDEQSRRVVVMTSDAPSQTRLSASVSVRSIAQSTDIPFIPSLPPWRALRGHVADHG